MTRPTLFRLGTLTATPGALAALAQSGQTPVGFLARHVSGDWGDLCSEDRRANNQALRQGNRILSVYHTANAVKLWIITEADRSHTTILLPDEY
jgi:hypothetical protein